MRKVELYERIRRDHAERGWSVRRLAREHRVHRREVRQALASAQPPAPARLNRQRPVLGPLTPVIDAILEQDRQAPRKQRHTAHRIWERLVSEHGAEIAEATVRRYVGGRKRELYGPSEVMVPQVHLPGLEAEVDLSESWVGASGIRRSHAAPWTELVWLAWCRQKQAGSETDVARYPYAGGLVDRTAQLPCRSAELARPLELRSKGGLSAPHRGRETRYRRSAPVNPAVSVIASSPSAGCPMTAKTATSRSRPS